MMKKVLNFFNNETWTICFFLEKLKEKLSPKSVGSSPLPTMIFVAMNSITACFSLVVLVEAQRILKEASVVLREREEALAVRALELAAMEEKSFVTFHQMECLGLAVIGSAIFLLIFIWGHPRLFPLPPDAPTPPSEIMIIYLDEKFWQLSKLAVKTGRKIAKAAHRFDDQFHVWIKKMKREAWSAEVSNKSPSLNKVTQADSLTPISENGSSLPELSFTIEKVWMNETAPLIEVSKTPAYYKLTQADILTPLPELYTSLPELVFTIEKVWLS